MNRNGLKKSALQGQAVLMQNESSSMKLDVRFKRYINTALIIGPMTMIMAVVGVMRNSGPYNGWLLKCLLTWLTMFPIAYICAFFIIPVANKITGKIKFKGEL